MRRRKPKWNAEGQPMNLEAAATDALEWLYVARGADLMRRLTQPDRQSLLDERTARLGRAIQALKNAIQGEFPAE